MVFKLSPVPVVVERKLTEAERLANQALAFNVALGAAKLLPEQLESAAVMAIGSGAVVLDAHGMLAGAEDAALGEARAIWQSWQRARHPFDIEIEAQRVNLDAVVHAEAETNQVRAAALEAKDKAEQQWRATPANKQAEDNFQQAQTRLKQKKDEHANRAPVMRSYSKAYWGALLAIGCAEWLINYDVFLLFTGVPAIAGGATIILGVLLAYAAHAHGEVLRQWTYRFNAAAGRDGQNSSIRLLALATIALLVVLGAAGGSRYAAVLRTLASQSGANILGAASIIEVDPLRDVLLSLLANFGAWIVGVFISFYSHDRDPVYMETQHQFDRSNRLYLGRHKSLAQSQGDIHGKAEGQVDRLMAQAKSRSAEADGPRRLLAQIDHHGATLLTALRDDIRHSVHGLRTVVLRSSGVALHRQDAEHKMVPITPAEFRALEIDAAALFPGRR